jgi:hypothetical protein
MEKNPSQAGYTLLTNSLKAIQNEKHNQNTCFYGLSPFKHSL